MSRRLLTAVASRSGFHATSARNLPQSRNMDFEYASFEFRGHPVLVYRNGYSNSGMVASKMPMSMLSAKFSKCNLSTRFCVYFHTIIGRAAQLHLFLIHIGQVNRQNHFSSCEEQIVQGLNASRSNIPPRPVYWGEFAF